jgi:hypothetical protein
MRLVEIQTNIMLAKLFFLLCLVESYSAEDVVMCINDMVDWGYYPFLLTLLP